MRPDDWACCYWTLDSPPLPFWDGGLSAVRVFTSQHDPDPPEHYPHVRHRQP